MAIRPVFIPRFSGISLVEEQSLEFKWSSGFSVKQKKKNIAALHLEAKRNGIGRVLEISSKSNNEIGRRLSAFSLRIEIDKKKYPLESVYQGCKVFEKEGAFPHIFEFKPLDAKRFVQSLDCGKLIEFDLLGNSYSISPKNAFYDWLYIRSLMEHADWIEENVAYDAFTDIEFNPKKQFNCQARAFAEYLSFLARGKLSLIADDFECFAEMLYVAENAIKQTGELQLAN